MYLFEKLKDFYQQNQTKLNYYEPAIEVALVMICYYLLLLCNIVPKQKYSNFIILGLIFLSVALLCFAEFALRQRVKIGKENIYNSLEIYLNGFYVWDLLDNGCFSRLGHYIGHGLCYEASTLEMLAWHSNPKSRLVYGEAYSDLTKEKVEHCWIELKRYGLWWVIDPTWSYPACPELRIIYYLNNGASKQRVISYEEFWSFPFAQEIYFKLHDSKTSFLLGELSLFRKSTDNQSIAEASNLHNQPIDGSHSSLLTKMIYVTDSKNPVTDNIFRDFAIRAKRENPKRRSYREAIATQKVMKVISSTMQPQ